MQITLSYATTSDHYLDDRSPERLVLSTPEDWAEVYRLRALHDAILVGAETVRRDDPSLRLRIPEARAERLAAGLRPDPVRVTLTASGDLSPAARLFTTGEGERIVFAPRELPALNGAAEVIPCDAPITAAQVVTELEKRGIRSLFVEGGPRTLRLFLEEGLADRVRVAVNPAMTLGAERGGARFRFEPPAGAVRHDERFGTMETTTWVLHPDRSAEDRRLLAEAIDVSRRCTPSPACYRVGAVVVAADGSRYTGYTHETSPTHHAEQEAIAKALAAGAELRRGTICSSMEPCSRRASEPESCTELILRHGFGRVVFACYEPDCFVRCEGALRLRRAGVEVRVYPESAEEVRRINGHLFAGEA